MYNANYPKENELPTTKQLIISVLTAITVALALLISCVLPAEYGIDPTGIGKVLGLRKMGETKMQLAAEAEAGNTTDIQALATPKPIHPEEPAIAITSKTMTLSLVPGAAAEVKVTLNKGASVSYHWMVDAGHVNFDNHGDNPSTKYHNYSKGKAATHDKGKITAAFDGSHGWFWRNRSSEVVTVTLNVSGKSIKLKRIL